MKKVINCISAPAPKGAYSHAVYGAGLVFVSGQLPIDPQTNEIVKGDIKIQTKMVMDNIHAILSSEGIGLSNVVKATVYLADFKDFVEMDKVYAEYFPKDPPARAAVAVGQLPPGVLIEIEVVVLGN